MDMSVYGIVVRLLLIVGCAGGATFTVSTRARQCVCVCVSA